MKTERGEERHGEKDKKKALPKKLRTLNMSSPPPKKGQKSVC